MRKKFFNVSIFWAAFLALVLIIAVPSTNAQPDPTGAKTGTIQDVPAANPGSPTITEIGDAAGHNKIAINIIWTLITGFLVMFMQAGFAMVETGFTQSEKCRPHNGNELYGLCHRINRVLDLRVCINVWRCWRYCCSRRNSGFNKRNIHYLFGKSFGFLESTDSF